MTHDSDEHAAHPAFWQSRYALGLCVIGGVALFFLITQHRAHLLGALPYVLLLACPLMHLFMHHGQRRHRHHRPGRAVDRDEARISTDKQP